MLLSHSTLIPPQPHLRLRHIYFSAAPTSCSFNPNQPSDVGTLVKMPTAPWMKGAILLQPEDLIHHSNSYRDGKENDSDCVFTGKTIGKRGDKDVKRIAECLEKLQVMDDSNRVGGKVDGDFGFVGIFEKLKRKLDVDLRVVVNEEAKRPWYKNDQGQAFLRRTKKERLITKAELSLDTGSLYRLRNEARRMRKWVKVMKAGVTRDVVNEIKLIWMTQELVMVRFYVPLCRNMDRASEIIEMKTGGLVVWTKKDTLVVYRGADSSFQPSNQMHLNSSKSTKAFYLKERSKDIASLEIEEHANLSLQLNGNSRPFKGMNLNDVVVYGSLYEREADRLLEGVGPRYVDWWMSKPLPVDGDLLPKVIPGYMPPPRRCPPYGKSSITDDDLTYLRKLAKPLPTHFVLGRNRNLQGLASAIVKLWEKTHIVKIAIKWGAINTSNEQMARELKGLTGGNLLLRNKYLIILYRGKDFLPSGVANTIMDRDAVLRDCLLNEEDARLRAAHDLSLWYSVSCSPSALGTLSEHRTIGSLNLSSVVEEGKIRLDAEKEKLQKEMRIQEHKLFILNKKIKRSAVKLSDLNSKWTPSIASADTEIITEEERECLLKVALKMSKSLVLGRRGIFDGVLEGIYQHWKYREVVSVITMQRLFSRVIRTAKTLEAESRGVLISIKKLKKGHAIILYRGKNYKRPSVLETKNLLTKREAYLRSIEMQRLGSLKYFANQRQRKITDLKWKLEDLEKEIQGVSKNVSRDTSWSLS